MRARRQKGGLKRAFACLGYAIEARHRRASHPDAQHDFVCSQLGRALSAVKHLLDPTSRKYVVESAQDTLDRDLADTYAFVENNPRMVRCLSEEDRAWFSLSSAANEARGL